MPKTRACFRRERELKRTPCDKGADSSDGNIGDDYYTGTHSADLGASLQTGGPYGHPVGTLYNVLVLSRVFIPRSTGYRTR